MKKDKGSSDQPPPEDLPSGTGESDGGRKRYIVTLAEGAHEEAVKVMAQVAPMKNLARATDFGEKGVSLAEIADADAVIFDNIGIAAVHLESDQLAKVCTQTGEESAILAIEPEGEMYVVVDSLSYVRGYRDGVSQLADKLLSAGTTEVVQEIGVESTFSDTPTATWGIQATQVLRSRFTGRGIKVAILDTGLDFRHPDFAGRAITSRSFISGVPTAQDGHGHGTHVTGTACGPKVPGTGRRYGIAYEAKIFIGKVLSDAGSGGDVGILAGIDWAITNGCAVISMSLGAPRPPVMAYEIAAQRGLARGTLIIAAAGNSSHRPGIINPVGSPANSPSIMGVASLDQDLGISFYSDAGVGYSPGQVDIAAPGRNVYSSWPMSKVPPRYNIISGTSMATPHVSGIAALWAQARNVRGHALWQTLVSNAHRLTLPSRDVGSGIVYAP